jgi:hypothetical protein
MSAGAVDPPAEATGTTARVRVAKPALARPVLCRVVSMALTRADWPIDRLDDAMLACDALCAHAGDYTADGALTLDVHASNGTLELRVGELRADGAEALVRDAQLPGVGNVLEHVAERISIEPDEQSGGSQLVLVISP